MERLFHIRYYITFVWESQRFGRSFGKIFFGGLRDCLSLWLL